MGCFGGECAQTSQLDRRDSSSMRCLSISQPEVSRTTNRWLLNDCQKKWAGWISIFTLEGGGPALVRSRYRLQVSR